MDRPRPARSAPMPTPEEIAQLAMTCARDALDRLVGLIGSGAPWDGDSAAPEKALIEMTRARETDQADRSSWEGHAALDLLMGARLVLAPADDAIRADEERT
jgi:hypothetical protein